MKDKDRTYAQMREDFKNHTYYSTWPEYVHHCVSGSEKLIVAKHQGGITPPTSGYWTRHV